MTTSVSLEVKQAIEAWVAHFRQSVLREAARMPDLPPRLVGRYLESLRYLLLHSERHLVVAAARSQALGRAGLAALFQRKSHEEDGHVAWADSDLSQLPAAATAGLTPAPGIIELVELQRELIDRDPLLFAVYTVWAEYMTVLTGGEWLAILSACGYEHTQVSAVSKHLEVDREHATHCFDELESLWTGEPSLEALLAVIERAGRIFEKFCDELRNEVRSAA